MDGTKPLLEPTLAQIHVAICRHYATKSYSDKQNILLFIWHV